MTMFPGLWVACLTAVPLARQAAPDPSAVEPGWLGFGVFLGLAVALVLLWLSFRKQLRKVNFEEEPPESADGSSDRRVRPS
jgi:hypothetical protein